MAPGVRTQLPLIEPSVRPDQSAVPTLSVVIVNYCQWHNTARLVRQLRSSAAVRRGLAEILVVDNRSPLDPVAGRMRRWPGVSVYRAERNHGFAGGVNVGRRVSRGGWILLLNPDMSLPEGFLDEVLRRIERMEREEPDVGVVGFALADADGTPQGSCGEFPTLAGSLSGLLRPRKRRKYLDLPAGYRGPVPWVTGCCLLLGEACARELGGFDGDYFLYYEDVDLCRRARAAGWRVWFEPEPVVRHHHPLHARKVSPYLRLLTRHALLTYARKHWPRSHFLALCGVVGLEACVRQLRAWWKRERAAGRLFADLARMAAEFARGRADVARQRLDRRVRQEGRRVRVVLRRHSQLLADRPAGTLPAQPANPRGA